MDARAYRLLSGFGFGFVAVLLSSLASPSASGATVSGTLPMPGVVWVSDDSNPAPVPGREMRNVNQTFVPDLLVVSAGSSVRFPNDDDFFHSVYSSSPADPFDVGFYDSGPGKLIAFPRPGVVDIRCHIHGAMRATIVVVDGPWHQTLQPNEAYRIDGVRSGRHVLHVWTPAGGEQTSEVKL